MENQTANTVNTVIDNAVKAAETTAENSIETALDSAAPIFAAPVLHQVSDEIIKIVVEKMGSELSVNLQKVGTFIVIDTQVSSEKTGISKALQDLMLAEKSGNQEAIHAAIQAYQAAQSHIVNSDGSATPVV